MRREKKTLRDYGLLTAGEAATQLNRGLRTIYNLIKAGKLPHIPVVRGTGERPIPLIPVEALKNFELPKMGRKTKKVPNA